MRSFNITIVLTTIIGIICLLYIDNVNATLPGDCTRGNCCGEGTRWQDGTGCVPTTRGIIDACKKKRGNWGWTCEKESVCA